MGITPGPGSKTAAITIQMLLVLCKALAGTVSRDYGGAFR